MVKYLIFLFTLLLPLDAVAQFRGLTVFGMMNKKFPCRPLLRAMKGVENPAVQVVASSFGSDFSCMRKFLKQRGHGTKAVFVHPFNNTCARLGRKCFKEDLNFHKRRRSEKFIRQLAMLTDKYKAKLYISYGLEDAYTKKEAKKVKRWLLKKFSDAAGYIRNSIIKLAAGSMLIERHGVVYCTGKTSVASLDGSDITGRQIANWAFLNNARRCLAVLLWRPRWQGIFGQRFIKPTRRDFVFNDTDVLLIKDSLWDGSKKSLNSMY